MRGVVIALVAGMGGASLACGGAGPPPSTQSLYAEPQWQDAFDATPELLLVVRPKALRRDKVYGPLLVRVIGLAAQQNRTVSAIHALDAIEDAEEVIVAVRADARGSDQPSELVFVVRGVRADIDPGHLVDADGHKLWSPGPSGAVRELEGDSASAASLFELPGRTWVIATGDARMRARDAFAHPIRRPAMRVDPDALAIARVDGPSLVAHARALGSTGGLAAVGHKLQSAMIELPAGADGPEARAAERDLRATLAYLDEDAAALAELKLRAVVEALARSKRAGLAWLTSARIERPSAQGNHLLVTAPLPPALIDALLRAGSASLELDPAQQ